MFVKTKEGKVFEGTFNHSILDSALKSNLVFEHSCKTGQCGVCKATLFEGEVFELQPQIALNEHEKQKKLILTCCCSPKSDILIDAEDLSALHGIESRTLPVRINSIKSHTKEIIEVTLKLPPSANFQFLSGQYIVVILNSIRRSYSVASISSQKEVSLLIKRFEYGIMSEYWFNHAKENDLLRIEGPKGTFFLRESSKPLLFLATGTGIAPIISILKSLDENHYYRQENSVTLYWGNRYEEEFVWKPKFKKIKVEFIMVCSRPTKNWKGSIGHVHNCALQNETDLLNCAVYACGSFNMIQSAKKLFTEVGLLENQFYSDAFLQNH
jgi:CDP-4-dehydro-6-deoxyglucose reductase